MNTKTMSANRAPIGAVLRQESGTAEGDDVCRVACVLSIDLSEIARIVAQFNERVPHAVLHIEYLPPDAVYAAVLSDRSHLGIVVNRHLPSKDVQATLWRTERMVVALAPGHSLAQRASLSPSDLHGYEFIGFDDDLPIGREVSNFFRDTGVKVRQTLHFDNVQIIKEAIAATGSAFSILPEVLLRQDIIAGRLQAVPLQEPGLWCSVGILQGRHRKLNRAAQAFFEILMENGGGSSVDVDAWKRPIHAHLTSPRVQHYPKPPDGGVVHYDRTLRAVVERMPDGETRILEYRDGVLHRSKVGS